MEIAEDVKRRETKYSFNFSEWVSQRYDQEFMSMERKQKEIEELNHRITVLKREVSEMGAREELLRSTLTRSEMRTIESICQKIDEGFDPKALCDMFNNTHNRDLMYGEFMEMVEYVKKRKEKDRRGKKRS